MTRTCAAIGVRLDCAGAAQGPLLGKSFVVKENYAVEGCVSTNGHPEFAAAQRPAPAHAPAIARLLAAGARLVGKAQMDEMAYSLFGANPHYGTPENPAAPDRHPGGSSSGSASAVAAGLCDFALGTDTAGSCRAPASFCGVFGFRPSQGAVCMEGVVPMASSLDAAGWFARDAQTLRAVGDVLLPMDLTPAPAQAKIAANLLEASDPEAREACARPLQALRRLSPTTEATLDEEFLTQAPAHFRKFQAYEVWAAHGAWIERAQPRFGPGVAERLAFAKTVTRADYEAAAAFRRAAQRKMDALLDGAVLAFPTAPCLSPMLDASAATLDALRARLMRFFLTASFFGYPQVSIPLSSTAAPLGLSLLGPRWSDRAVLQIAHDLTFIN